MYITNLPHFIPFLFIGISSRKLIVTRFSSSDPRMIKFMSSDIITKCKKKKKKYFHKIFWWIVKKPELKRFQQHWHVVSRHWPTVVGSTSMSLMISTVVSEVSRNKLAIYTATACSLAESSGLPRVPELRQQSEFVHCLIS